MCVLSFGIQAYCISGLNAGPYTAVYQAEPVVKHLTFVRQFSDCGCLDSYTNNFSSAHTSPVISLSGLSGQRVIT